MRAVVRHYKSIMKIKVERNFCDIITGQRAGGLILAQEVIKKLAELSEVRCGDINE